MSGSTRAISLEERLQHWHWKQFKLLPKYQCSIYYGLGKVGDELGRFRTAIGLLCAKIERDLPLAAMKQEIFDLYKNELELAISDLKGALDGQKISWLTDALLKASFLSTGPTSMLVAGGGIAVPQALLVGAGISLVGLGILYSVERNPPRGAPPCAARSWCGSASP